MVEIEKSIDKYVGKLQKKANEKISYFVAFLFFLIAIGGWIGVTIYHYWPNQAFMAVLLPLLAGAVAYYNRAFAVGIFVLLILIMLL